MTRAASRSALRACCRPCRSVRARSVERCSDPRARRTWLPASPKPDRACCPRAKCRAENRCDARAGDRSCRRRRASTPGCAQSNASSSSTPESLQPSSPCVSPIISGRRAGEAKPANLVAQHDAVVVDVVFGATRAREQHARSLQAPQRVEWSLRHAARGFGSALRERDQLLVDHVDGHAQIDTGCFERWPQERGIGRTQPLQRRSAGHRPIRVGEQHLGSVVLALAARQRQTRLRRGLTTDQTLHESHVVLAGFAREDPAAHVRHAEQCSGQHQVGCERDQQRSPLRTHRRRHLLCFLLGELCHVTSAGCFRVGVRPRTEVPL